MNKTKVKYSFAEWCRDNNHQDWLDLWDYELNNVLPEEVAYRTEKQYWFKCPKGMHQSELCAPCSISKWKTCRFCLKCRSFGQWLIDNFGNNAIQAYWSNKNNIDWFSIGVCSQKVIFVKCGESLHPDYPITPQHFVEGDRCPICSNHKIIAGINDIATTHPEYVKYFKNPNDATLYSVHSGKKVWFRCPLCGNEKYTDICTALSNGYSCLSCRDGVSFNNKFIYCFLKQLQDRDHFILHTEKVFDWSKNIANSRSKRLYDFYVGNGQEIIIEAHGEQHFEHGFDKSYGGRTAEEEQANDIFKYELALNNGINEENYIVLNCRISQKNFLVDSIMSSRLPYILNFTKNDIDWDKCEQFAYSNLVKQVGELWNSGVRKLADISDITGLARSTVSKYLRQADMVGWIIYESPTNKPVICLENNYVFKTSNVCSALSNQLFGLYIKAKHIQSNANGEISSTHNMHFQYITRAEFRAIKECEPHRVYE